MNIAQISLDKCHKKVITARVKCSDIDVSVGNFKELSDEEPYGDLSNVSTTMSSDVSTLGRSGFILDCGELNSDRVRGLGGCNRICLRNGRRRGADMVRATRAEEIFLPCLRGSLRAGKHTNYQVDPNPVTEHTSRIYAVNWGSASGAAELIAGFARDV